LAQETMTASWACGG